MRLDKPKCRIGFKEGFECLLHRGGDVTDEMLAYNADLYQHLVALCMEPNSDSTRTKNHDEERKSK